MFALLSGVAGFVKQGRLNALAITAAERSAVLPGVPTMPELGFPTLRSGSWQGIFVPANTPLAIVQHLFATTSKAMNHPDIMKRLTDNGVALVLSTSQDEFAALVRAETGRFAAIVKEAGITADQ